MSRLEAGNLEDSVTLLLGESMDLNQSLVLTTAKEGWRDLLSLGYETPSSTQAAIVCNIPYRVL